MPIRKVEEICVFNNGVYYPQITDGHVPTNSSIGKTHGKAYHGINRRLYHGGDTTRYPTNILDFKCVDNYSRVHSSQKPVELIEYLIKTYTNEGDSVLDNCAGSFMTAVACDNLNRKWICIEKEKDYCEIGLQRINENRLKLNIPLLDRVVCYE